MPFRRFLKSEYGSAVLLLVAAALAIALANSPWAAIYHDLLHETLDVPFGAGTLHITLAHVINDGLMTIFFLVVGLEIKREFMGGELGTPAKAVLPIIAALGGVVAPALVYLFVNQAEQPNWPGWAIPTATDIAFALGLLAIAGRGLPAALKVFLTALAIIDDLIAILIIATFYGGHIAMLPFFIMAALLAALLGLNLMGVRRLLPYLLLGAALWLAVIYTGLHATLAGVMLAVFIPLAPDKKQSPTPLHRLEHALHPFSAYLIMPLFALANAGISLEGLSPAAMLAPLPLGIALALWLGKPAGIFFAAQLAIHLKWAQLPSGMTTRHLFALACLAGIGFTMSLFIGALAFPQEEALNLVRLGVIAGSCLAAITGGLLLRRA